ELAESFASGVLRAIRGASLDDLMTESGAHRGAPAGARSPSARAGRKARSGRLARRSADDINKSLSSVVGLVKSKGAMRSEQIRDALKLDKRELPRVLHEGLAQ